MAATVRVPRRVLVFGAMRVRETSTARCDLRSATLAALIAALALSACGSDDFENAPRPPIPLELTAAIDDRRVSVSPSELGAGTVVITISNQTADPTRLVLEGPTDAQSGEIVPGGTGSIKTTLEEGEYEAAAGAEIDIKTTTVTVGPERESSKDELLQP